MFQNCCKYGKIFYWFIAGFISMQEAIICRLNIIIGNNMYFELSENIGSDSRYIWKCSFVGKGECGLWKQSSKNEINMLLESRKCWQQKHMLKILFIFK